MMIVYSMMVYKGDGRTDELIENYLTLEFPSPLWSVLASYTVFWFYDNFTLLVYSHHSHYSHNSSKHVLSK